MHRVAVLALDQVVPFDLAVGMDTFSVVNLQRRHPAYRVRVCGLKRTVTTAGSRMRLQLAHGLPELARADTIVLPGTSNFDVPVPSTVLRALLAAARRGARIASICTGAFQLAATGLLNGLRATTHWRATGELARRYPQIQVEPDVLYVDNGQLLTSAGVAAGVDLCLHLIRRDYGAATAAEAARSIVMPPERDGSQPQLIQYVPPADDGSSLAPLLGWLEQNVHRDLTLESIARQGRMSVRSLNRRFHDQTGTTPLQWMIRARVRRAQVLLETTTQSVEQIASSVGYGSVNALRQQFRRIAATTPQLYRSATRAQHSGSSARART